MINTYISEVAGQSLQKLCIILHEARQRHQQQQGYETQDGNPAFLHEIGREDTTGLAAGQRSGGKRLLLSLLSVNIPEGRGFRVTSGIP